jgi:hypothetical protein
LAVRFAQAILENYNNRESFEFDLKSNDYDEVRTVLEVGGFSVRCDKLASNHVIAWRAEPNLAPCVPKSTFALIESPR